MSNLLHCVDVTSCINVLVPDHNIRQHMLLENTCRTSRAHGARGRAAPCSPRIRRGKCDCVGYAFLGTLKFKRQAEGSSLHSTRYLHWLPSHIRLELGLAAIAHLQFPSKMDRADCHVGPGENARAKALAIIKLRRSAQGFLSGLTQFDTTAADSAADPETRTRAPCDTCEPKESNSDDTAVHEVTRGQLKLVHVQSA